MWYTDSRNNPVHGKGGTVMSTFGFRLTALLLTVSLGAVPLKVHAEESPQKCGDSIIWEFSEGTLTLTGEGEMYDYTAAHAPWAANAADIRSIQISDGIETIGNNAFSSCNAAELVIPDSVVSIGDYACSHMNALQTVRFPAHLRRLGNYAFTQCTVLSAAVLPDGLESVGDSCFSMDFELQQVTVPDSVKHFGNGVFFGAAAWYRAQTEDFVIFGDGILCAYLGNDAEVSVPDTVSQICSDAFAARTFLQMPFDDRLTETVMLTPNTGITDVTLPDSVHMIPDFLFENMTGLKRVHLPDSVTEIGARAFSGCSSLAELNIPASVTSIGQYALNSTLWLKKAGDYVVVGDGILYAFQGRQKILHIPETVKTINPDAVKSDKIMEVICPASVTEIQTGGIQGKYLTIVGTPGTAAEAYAVQNQIPFRDMNAEPPQGTDMTLDFEKDIWSFGNSGKVFGGDYYLSDTDRERLTELGISTSSNQSWGGSCVGLSVTVILAKNGVFAPVQLQSGADSLAEIEPTEDVVSFINYFQRIQGRSDASSAYEHDDLMFCRMVNTAKNVQYGESPFLLTFATKNGSHAVVGYGQESGKWTYDGKTYDARILVWDSNSPNALRDSSCLYYDIETLDYCIPQYGVHVAEGADDDTAGIITVCNDLGVLNAYPYPFESHYQTGDINCDGKVSVADAVLLSRFLTAQTELSDSQMMLADVSGDKKLNAADLTVLKQQLLYQSNVKA